MNAQHRLTIARVRLAALQGLVDAGGAPTNAQLGRAALPLLVNLVPGSAIDGYPRGAASGPGPDRRRKELKL